ncbi:MAG TPA: DoxX family protein [Gemmatimonadaceae bacterium]|jgi:putative oxidoreductase
MSIFDRATARQIDVGLAIVRVIGGVTFFAHGYQKVFIFGFSGVAGFFGQMGVPMPGVMGPAIGILELVGGLALILGLFTRVFGFLLACDIFGAIVLVRAKGGFFAPNGTEFELALCAIAVTLAIVGAGGFSADGVLARRRASL